MQITIDLSKPARQTLIALANGLATEIESTNERGGYYSTVRSQFTAICNELERRGVDISATVHCPENY